MTRRHPITVTDARAIELGELADGILLALRLHGPQTDAQLRRLPPHRQSPLGMIDLNAALGLLLDADLIAPSGDRWAAVSATTHPEGRPSLKVAPRGNPASQNDV